ncbi:3D domain-containing protein [Fervidobacterium sp.]
MAEYKGPAKMMMMKNRKDMLHFIAFINIALFLLVSSSCAPLGSYFYLSMQTENIQNRIENIEKALNDNKTSQNGQQFEDISVKNSINELQNSISKIESKINQIEKSQNSLQSSFQNIKTSTEQLSKQISASEKNYSTVQNKISTLESKVNQIESLQKDIDSLSAQIRNLQRDVNLSVSQSDIDFLKQLQEQINDIKRAMQSIDVATLLRIDTGYILYSVKSGDTLNSIANAYKVSLNTLIDTNGIKDPTKLAIGQLIKIPVGDPKSYVRPPLKINPTDIIAYHGQERNGFKTIGMDIYAKGKDVYPILPGRVINVDNNTVTIDHGNMIMTIYSGISTNLRVGNFVSTDKPLGQVIDILHFELYIEGEPRDPIRLFTEYKGIFTVTFYSEWDDGKVPNHPTFRIARNGRVPKQFLSIAVDPNVIPLGSLVYIPTLSNVIFIAEDTGSAIKGNRIDVYVSDVRLALNKGISPHAVYVLKTEVNN